MKKLFGIVFILILLAAVYLSWLFFGPATGFNENYRFLYIRSDKAHKNAIIDSFQSNKFIKHIAAFIWLTNRMHYWNGIKPGKYKINNGASLISIIRMLRNGQQSSVNLVITKVRTRMDLAHMIGIRFECDSTQMIDFLQNNDSLKVFGLDSVTVMTAILPDTYTYFWNTTPRKIFQKWFVESEKFWTEERKQKAANHGLTPQQAYILASIIEEETNSKSDKPIIASVYLNRIVKKMPLQADPTIKFALNDFTLKRIYEKYTFVQSPYNTYRNTGLPPGPICTPSIETMEAVLNSPKTDYLYFVANSDLSGTHIFTTNYTEHLKFAKEYQQVLNKLDSVKSHPIN